MSSTKSITEKEVQALIQGKLSRYFGVSPKEATTDQIYKAVVMSVRDILLEKRQPVLKVFPPLAEEQKHIGLARLGYCLDALDEILRAAPEGVVPGFGELSIDHDTTSTC